MALFKNNDRRLRNAFNAVHHEFEEHLESINQNTHEILENRCMLLELQERITELAADIGEIKEQLGSGVDTSELYEPIELTIREQEVFLVLYTSDSGVSYNTMSSRLQLPVSLVQELVYSLIMKGVPIIKQREGHELSVRLDMEFREYQSKHNIVGIEEGISKQMSSGLQQKLV